MKHVLLLLLIFVGLNTFSQTCSSYFIPDSLIKKEKALLPGILSGSCASPDGPMLQIASTPSGYAYLLANGYCYTIAPASSFTMCFTFIAPSANVLINSGYSSTGCFFTFFSNLNLYTCSPGCALVGTGTSFSGLIPGQCYTWCLQGTCFGGTFDHVCPYYIDNTPLPVTFLYFQGVYKDKLIYLNWATGTETNCNFFSLERSIDGDKWEHIMDIKGAGNTSMAQYYPVIDQNPIPGIDYYRLKQVDYNGNFMYSSAIAIPVPYFQKKIVKIINELGQEINSDTKGFYIIFYDNGTIKKGYKY